MPRRVSPIVRHSPHNARRELITTTPGATLTAGALTSHATDVPLFRRGENGGLQQAIRLWIETPTPQDGVTLTSRSGDRVHDRATVSVEPGAASFHVFVPEVDSPTTFVVTLDVPGADSATADIVVAPQRKWSIYLVHHSHFDYGYTDPQAIVMEHQLRYLDAVLDLCAASDDWPEDAKFRWNVEVTYPLKQWLAARPKTARDEFFRRVNEGRIEVHALPFSMHTEVYSIDELAWGLKFTDELREQHGLDVVSAIQSDVPGHTIGLLTLLTAAGIRFFNVAHNYAGRSLPFNHGGQELTRPFWWQGADGKRLLVWYTDTPHGLAYMDGVYVGLSQSEPTARGLLPDYLKALASRPYPYDKRVFGWHGLPPELEVTKQPYPHDILHFRIQNGFADNAPPSLTIAAIVRDWNAAWAYPHLRMATNRDFFTEAESRLGDTIDTFTGDWTDWWADGIGSAALPLGLNRRAQGTIRTARTLHTLASSVTDDPAPTVETEIDRVYEDLALFDEHTWGAANPWNQRLDRVDSGDLQWGRKSAFAYQAAERADTLLNSGLHRFAGAFKPAPDALASLIVFNPSAWPRTDLVRLFLPAERVPPGRTIAIVDSRSGQTIPHDLEPQPHPNFRAKGQWLTFAAPDLPSVGYARFVVEEAAGEPAPANPEARPADDFVLESRYYRVTVDPREGFISSIVDRETGRELVNTDAPFGFNEYIYDRYTSAAGWNHLSGRIVDIDQSLLGSRTTAGNAWLANRTSDPVAEHLTVRLVAQGTDGLETTLTLPHHVKRLDITNRLFKQATMEKESVYFAFPFAVADPDPEYEISGGVTSQAAPHVPGSVRHMFGIRHWLALHDAQGAAAWATLEAPLIELGTIALPYVPFPSTLPADRTNPATVYSWALNNLWDTNFPPQQGGEMTFRYSVASDTTASPRQLGIRTGAALCAPLTGFCLGRTNAGTLRPSGSFVELSNPLVEVVSLAPSSQGHGLVAYLHSLAPETIDVNVSFPALEVTKVATGNFLERGMAEVPLSGGTATIELAPGAYVALAIDLA
jgi:hypothetical protein